MAAPLPAGFHPPLGKTDFTRCQALFRRLIGLHLTDSKQQLVTGRLGQRVAKLGLSSFREYIDLLESGRDPAELQIAIDQITTNETSFFREPDHFRILENTILPLHPAGRPIRIWCGASSTGEEPYTIAMVLDRAKGPSGWDLLATDINQKVLETARAGIYPMARSSTIPHDFLKAYCLRGYGDHHDTFAMKPELRARVEFRAANLMELPGSLTDLDIVFLRNVLIYFDVPTREALLTEVWRRLRPGGWLLLSHSESLVGLRLPVFSQVRPSVYRKPLDGVQNPPPQNRKSSEPQQ